MVPVAPLDDLPSVKTELPAKTQPPEQAGREAVSASGGSPRLDPSPVPASLPKIPGPDSGADPLLGATTLLVRIAPGVDGIDDLNGRKVAVGYSDAARQAAVAATFRSLSLTPELLVLQPDEAERQFQAGDIKAIATLADSATAAQAPDKVLRVRLEPYVVRPPRQPPS